MKATLLLLYLALFTGLSFSGKQQSVKECKHENIEYYLLEDMELLYEYDYYYWYELYFEDDIFYIETTCIK